MVKEVSVEAHRLLRDKQLKKVHQKRAFELSHKQPKRVSALIKITPIVEMLLFTKSFKTYCSNRQINTI